MAIQIQPGGRGQVLPAGWGERRAGRWSLMAGRWPLLWAGSEQVRVLRWAAESQRQTLEGVQVESS